MVHDGVLVPNTEFGHLTIRGIIAERYATAPIGIRKGRVLSWDEWCIRVGEYLALAGFVVHADLIVVGGGVSEKRLVPHWEGRIESSIPIVPARLKNQAGIIGAALRTRQEN